MLCYLSLWALGRQAIGNYAYNHDMVDAWTKVPPMLNQCCGEPTAACTLDGKIYVLGIVPALEGP